MSPLRRTLIAGAAALMVTGMLTACVPEPVPTSSSSAPMPTASSAAPSGSATTEPDDGDDLVLPAACEELYSPGMLATLQADIPPMNDPGTTMLSTENAEAIGVIESAEQTIRCSWGPPSERGIATNVTIITPEQRDALFTAFEQSGFSAEDYASGTIHRIQQEMITLDDELVTLGETHYLSGNGWVSTRWIQYLPEGYVEDIVTSLWG
ncbi:hypothetical protein [Microbacterium sp. SLBN-146]|uniref:hypothetical protein n=1 Tax=Microbacterium sp. SLBN-146 TaxID=2768457 RepID=UPI001150000B|nr:hypothetical protein [Microbacterium sp. SLBN-146]TQJ32526.1 hypothetical protein FBY39_3037 [Microbacterium sp. SLBN-146]